MWGCASGSREWQQRTEKDFPAGVSSIMTQLGNVLNENTGLGYGSWTVTFGEGGPYATYLCPKGALCEIKISNLQCAQSGGDSTACELILYKNGICEIAIPEKRKTFEIGCPLEVAFKEREKGGPSQPAAAAAAAKRSQEAASAAPTAPKGAGEAGAAAAESKPSRAAAAAAAPSEQAKGQSVAGDFVLGLRAGVALPTQQIIKDLSSGTSVGPLVNFEGYYVLREWVRLGMMVEWNQFNISSGNAKLGTLNTYSFLPIAEFRPTRRVMRSGLGFEWVIPYASVGAGVNAHSFSNASLLGSQSVSFPSTFAFRVAGGLDFPITPNLALNGEVAWKNDTGTFKTGTGENSFNASPLMFLFGLRVHF
jgi:hypothetical protein